MTDREDFWRSKELRVVLAGTVALVALSMALLHVVAARSDFIMTDFREWRPVPSTGPGPPGSIHRFENYFQHIQSPFPAQRPFRLTLQLEARALLGDRVAAERVFVVEPAHVYCFKVYASPRQPIEATEPTVDVLLYANGAPVASGPAWTNRVQVLEAKDILADGTAVHLRLEIRARRTLRDEILRRASKTDFEFATFQKC